MVNDGGLWGGGWDCGNFRVYLRWRKFLAWDVFVCDEVLEWWVLKGKLGGPRVFELAAANSLSG